MLHDIAPHTFSNTFGRPQPQPGDFLLCYGQDHVVLAAQGGGYALPTVDAFLSEQNAFIYFFSLDGKNCFWWPGCEKLPGLEAVPVQELRYVNEAEVVFIGITGFHLAQWYRNHAFCGFCGAATETVETERALRCPCCGRVTYPQIAPAVIVAITCGDKILLSRSTHYPSATYSHLAGYVEIGESLEDALRREVREEVGLEVTDITYYKSQPWPFSGSLMIAFFAKADCNVPLRPDMEEIVESRWFTAADLPKTPNQVSIAADMLDAFLAGRR